MNSNSDPYFFLGIYFLMAVGAAVAPLLIAWIVRPKKPGKEKNATYECGLETQGESWIQFKSEYYLYGIIFLIFDVELLFLAPFAVAFGGLPLGGFLAMMAFVLLLVEGWAWAWMKGILTWK